MAIITSGTHSPLQSSSHILYAAVYVMLSTVFSSPADSPLAGLQVQRVRESKTSHLTRDKGDLGNLSRDG